MHRAATYLPSNHQSDASATSVMEEVRGFGTFANPSAQNQFPGRES